MQGDFWKEFEVQIFSGEQPLQSIGVFAETRIIAAAKMAGCFLTGATLAV